MKQIRSRLTYANVMSSIAVFIVLGGAAVAATQLPKNSVGTKQLKKSSVGTKQLKKNAVTAKTVKKGAITTAKIKNEAVTGAQVNESTLGTVPSATLANTLPPLEATRLVGSAGQPGFENGSANAPAELGGLGLNPVGFYKDHQGIVHLQGVAVAGKATPIASVFTLPPGFRTAAGKIIVQEPVEGSTVIIFGSNVVIEGVDLSGKVVGGEEEPVVLDTITYRAES